MRLWTLALVTTLAAPVWGACTDDAMIVFDASGSMAEMGYNGLNEPRIMEAREAMHTVLPEVAPLRKIGLVTYGPGEFEMCQNVDLRFSPIENADTAILDVVDTIEPAGNTSLTQAVKDASAVLGSGTEKGTVVLITDGKETCGGAPCQLATALSDTSVTVHVIGFRVRDDFFNWEGGWGRKESEKIPTIARCLADETGGLYVSAETLDELIAALNVTLGCNQFSLLDAARR